MPATPPTWPPPPPGGIHGSNVNYGGAQAVGEGAHASMTNTYGPSTPQTALTHAVEALRDQLDALREQNLVSDDDVEYADQALDDLESEATRPEPNRHILRRSLDSVTSALGTFTQLTTAITALQTACTPLFPTP